MIKNFQEANDYLLNTIPSSVSKKFSGGEGLERAKKLMEKLGNPQNKLKVIHVAGTSGKGSTSYLISFLLEKLGFKVGLHLSPHLLDIRERCMINNRLIPEDKYVSYINEIIPKIKDETYFEITTALAYYVFFKEKVDYAVIETGLGGTYDATNLVKRKDKLCVITRIGLDHTRILGETIEEIAKQKYGIVGDGNKIVTLRDNPVIGKPLFTDFSNVSVGEKTIFEYDGEKVELGMLGKHQAENCSLALCALETLDLDWKKVKEELRNANFPARLEIMNIDGKTVIVDGAHNPEKMKALTEALKEIFPGKKFNFLLAFKKGKDYDEMLKYIEPIADNIIVTRFNMQQDLPRLSEEPKNIGIGNIVEDSKKALKKALALDDVVITGSLYLLFELYPILKHKQI